jgi:ERCC4-related helicase
MISPYHARYYASELTKRCPSDSVEKLSATLVDAKVDLNPHQVEAALFAFRSPLSRGAILADEVGLGKTIEAGILLAQKWAEGKRRLLIICPSSLRKQWSQELADKFFLPSIVLEAKSYNKLEKKGKRNPFDLNKIVICSYHFARNKADQISWIDWDIVVIDEAHRLRNVYKPDNKIGNAIKNAIYERPKVLLTATPLQNSLLELYGLVSIIDDNVFGDIKSFKAQFVRLSSEGDYFDLRDRLTSICQRTLRKQVREYVPYTNRTSITVKFEPTPDEQALYELVTSYLQRELLYALPKSQRHLMTLILRKLLASSTFAIAGTLQSLYKRLERLVDGSLAHHEELERLDAELEESLDTYGEIKEEYSDVLDDTEEYLTPEEVEDVKQEIDELKTFYELAQSITNNAKGENLMAALYEGFLKLRELGAQEKAIIFTESKRTQDYLLSLFENSEYKDQVVLFNGSNNDKKSKQIYESWIQIHKNSDKLTGSKNVDIRAALVDYFRNEAKIMIATEAAAEGINLQFCSMIVNYDLPWNPQRIEQRIGRCHRYGQKYDVVVVNFLNTKNAADRRVFQLLSDKFKLFDGVFGASDEVLGTIESGVDFEKRITEIYQNCRTIDEIQSSFDQLQSELDDKIENKLRTTRQKLLENFDQEVVHKLKIRLEESKTYLNKYEQWLWALMKYGLDGNAIFDDNKLCFHLKNNPTNLSLPVGPYTFDKKSEDEHIVRINHPLSHWIIKKIDNANLPSRLLTFDYKNFEGRISSIEKLVGKSGWMKLFHITVKSFEETDHLVLFAKDEDGNVLDDQQCRWFFSLPSEDGELVDLTGYKREMEDLYIDRKKELINTIKAKDSAYFMAEAEKLNKWAEDKITAAEKEIKDTKAKIKELNRASKTEKNTEELLRIQKELKDLQRKQRRQRQEIFDVEDQIEEQRDQMIREIEDRMQREIFEKELFCIKWELV